MAESRNHTKNNKKRKDVSFHYSQQSKESMNDKILRLIENDIQGQTK